VQQIHDHAARHGQGDHSAAHAPRPDCCSMVMIEKIRCRL
jgi:hypothetical protein